MSFVELATRPVSAPAVTRPLTTVSRRGSALSPTGGAFLRLLGRHCAGAPASSAAPPRSPVRRAACNLRQDREGADPRIAQDAAADELLVRDPLALLLGMLLDQHMCQTKQRHATGGLIEVFDSWSRPGSPGCRLARVRAHLDAGLAAVFDRYELSPADFQVIVTRRRADPLRGDERITVQLRS
jgi:hypothetical protein